MCKLIADLSGIHRREVSDVVKRLEARSGNPGLDISLAGEIYATLNYKMRSLGLDPKDTTARELYFALLNITNIHDQFLKQRVGIRLGADYIQTETRVADFVNELKLPRSVWVIKPTVIKKILTDNPPKKLMKLLGYRSADSMLRRETAGQLYAAAKLAESATWKAKLEQLIKKLRPSDFETKDLSIDNLESQKWGDAARAIVVSTGSHVIVSQETGHIMLLPLGTSPAANGFTLLTFCLVLKGMNELRMFSSYLKFRQMEPNFSTLASATFMYDHEHHVEVAGQEVKWRSVQKHYGKQKVDDLPAIFQPHVQAEDIAYRRAEEILYRLEPALHFWHKLDYVGLASDNGPVSMNLLDNAINLVNNFDFENRVYGHMQQSIWDELYVRYIAENAIENLLIEKLDNHMSSEPELIEQEMELAF